MTTIRPATRADVPQILAFVRELAEFEREPDAVVATEAMLEHALFGEGSAEAVMAEAGGKPVGFALFFHNFSTWTGRKGLYLEDLYVTPDARGQGVGTALLAHLAGVALDRDCARFEWAVLDWNKAAIDVYRKIGAVGMDEWRIQRVSGEALERLAGRKA
ncbi:GNAT family N-acetyltransferase [Alteraurantiacibacter aquimixticola]|uniref:GNAT family N-acetyltransferase n=1 Tax=Alteraurantiacibacter aquimixticola TaxID=2489173 RepID=A0A4T3F0F6_9SPHN|nr:GNAT family N-acetyltransferase [Alteraurantiacibacter aquimixticola]TIX48822.1 GNAT family N-acetyltransferase [Alteraurantiacibacter aquimixticola]